MAQKKPIVIGSNGEFEELKEEDSLFPQFSALYVFDNGYSYSGYEKNSTFIIRRFKDGVYEESIVSNLSSDWDNRNNLTYTVL